MSEVTISKESIKMIEVSGADLLIFKLPKGESMYWYERATKALSKVCDQKNIKAIAIPAGVEVEAVKGDVIKDEGKS